MGNTAWRAAIYEAAAKAALTDERSHAYLPHTFDWKHPYDIGFSVGFEAGVAASPSEELYRALVEAAEMVDGDMKYVATENILYPRPDTSYHISGVALKALRAALAALRTTKEGEG